MTAIELHKKGFASKTITYTNPVGGITNIGDPFILKAQNKYYLYATSDPSEGFRVWESSNLVDWSLQENLAYDNLDQSKIWAKGDFWAPEVVKHNNQYYMVYSARNEGGHLQISIATSKNPLGPFKDLSTEIIKGEGSYIDGDIFINSDGTPYLYYVKDCSENIIDGNHVSQIYAQKMNDNLTKVLGEPKLLLQPDQDWEGLNGDYQWNEGPYMLKHDNKYYLMYSANYFASSDYAIGYAVSDSPMGPFKKAEENPILKKDLKHGISGPGHNSVTVGPDGKTLYIVYHTHTDPNNPSGDRQLNIDRLYFDYGKLKVDGPTYSPQKIVIK
ncbi:glycoside hydrolase family 43 protein [Pullulanibacillus sp. KACC 23026]|uniref:glycoside hydrolase family 43 protein n=1 Tax=Pullulanibacillus sp. KACC 23026 TaxID=3028315 RepID=UPI0023B06405|nr:glycoside hydrolase family 43 protein [Pullulanibacillus sp. KACC 23026]WEG12832.1 glycoside hydrolase family 43 protein [Pullulanibacillus sp. KACC 23026]